MKLMNVKAIKLKDARFGNFHAEMSHWDYAEIVSGKHDDWMNDWISFDSILVDDRRLTVWCGLTSFAGDIFYGFDRSTRQFRSMNYQSVGDRYDAKFHRALFFDNQDRIWAATALLHDIDRYYEAPGGAIVQFDPNKEKLRIVSRPFPHLYIQGLTIDSSRGILYGITFTPERFFRYDIETGKATDLGPIGSGFRMAQGATIAVDRTGACWGTWGLTRAWLSNPPPDEIRLFRYHPDVGKIEYLTHGLPGLQGEAGTTACDEVHIGPDGAVYMGTAQGLLCRIDPSTCAVHTIGKPGPAQRLAAMANGPDGMFYGTAGNNGAVVLFSYDPKRDRLTEHGPIYDPELRQRAWHIHSLSISSDGTMYGGENDVPDRSGYLWEISGVI